MQFAFSNSSQTLDIDPKTATLALTMYDGGVALDKNELILSTSGEPQRLTYSIFGAGISDGDLVWISENEDIAAVDNTGLVTPKKAGKTVVSVKTADNSFKADCTVTVLQAAEDITIDKTSLSLLSGGKNGELTAKLLPETAVKRQIKWTSSDENVATVSSNGIVTPISVGETIITAAAADNEKLTASCNVTVAEMAEPQSISLDKENVSLPKLGATTVVNANIQPSDFSSISSNASLFFCIASSREILLFCISRARFILCKLNSFKSACASSSFSCKISAFFAFFISSEFWISSPSSLVFSIISFILLNSFLILQSHR